MPQSPFVQFLHHPYLSLINVRFRDSYVKLNAAVNYLPNDWKPTGPGLATRVNKCNRFESCAMHTKAPRTNRAYAIGRLTPGLLDFWDSLWGRGRTRNQIWSTGSNSWSTPTPIMSTATLCKQSQISDRYLLCRFWPSAGGGTVWSGLVFQSMEKVGLTLVHCWANAHGVGPAMNQRLTAGLFMWFFGPTGWIFASDDDDDSGLSKLQFILFNNNIM